MEWRQPVTQELWRPAALLLLASLLLLLPVLSALLAPLQWLQWVLLLLRPVLLLPLPVLLLWMRLRTQAPLAAQQSQVLKACMSQQ